VRTCISTVFLICFVQAIAIAQYPVPTDKAGANNIQIPSSFSGSSIGPTLKYATTPSGRTDIYVMVNISNQLTDSHWKAVAPQDMATWWIARIPASGTSDRPVHPDHVDVIGKTAFLTIKQPDQDRLRDGDKMNVFIYTHYTDNGTNKDVYVRGMTVSVKKSPLPSKAGFTPSFPHAQQLSNGDTKTVLTFDLDLEQTLFPQQNEGRIYVESLNHISTEQLDTTAQLEFGLGFEGKYYTFGATPGNARPFVTWLRLTPSLRYLSNQTTSNQTVDLTVPVTLSLAGLLPRVNTVFSPSLGPLLRLVPIEYLHRVSYDVSANPGHVQRDLLLLGAELDWQPIYLFAPRADQTPERIGRHPSLNLAAKVWYFPTDSAEFGYSVQRIEHFFDVELLFPILRGTSPLNTWFVLSYSDGASEANGFARSSQLSAAIRVLTFNINL